MTGTRNELVRAIRSRVPEVVAVDVDAQPGQRPIVSITPREGSNVAATLKRVADLRAYVAVAGVGYTVRLRDPHADAAPTTPLRGTHLLASIDADPTRSGLLQGIVRLVPEVARLVVEESLGKVRILVADSTGAAAEDLLNKCHDALEAMLPLGLHAEVTALPTNSPRNDLDRAGFLMPRRTPRLSRIARDENDRFAARMLSLVAGQSESVAPVDTPSGARVLVNTGSGLGRHPASLLPLFDRVFLMMSPHEEVDTFARSHGIEIEQLLAFARAGRIVPVFRFDLGVYSDKVVSPILEDPTIPFVTPRDLDYIAARFAWVHGSVGVPARVLREDRSLTGHLHDARVLLSEQIGDPKARALASTIDIALANAERFEGMFFRKGHVALQHVSPGAHVVQLVAAVARNGSESMQMAVINAGAAALNLGLSQAFDAALFDQLVQPEFIDLVAEGYVGHSARSRVSKVMPMVLEGLRVAYTPGLAIDEYLDLFDRRETERVRALVTDVLNGISIDDELQTELRSQLAALERDVAKIRKNAVKFDMVDLLANVSARSAPAAGAATISNALIEMASSTGKQIADALIEDTRLGGVVDRLRGAVNGVSGHAIRIYRLRSALAAMSR